MQVRLIKKLVKINEGTKDEMSFYSFYLNLDNGSSVKVCPNSYKDKKGNVKSNYKELVLIADDELPFDK